MAWHNDQVTELETEKILAVARESLVSEGDFVEMGCYKGDTSLLLAEILEGSDKKLWIYDSFEGLPEKSVADESVLGTLFQKGALEVSKREVKARFLRAGLRVPVIKKAWFNELSKDDLPEKIAFSFLDSVFYESIKESLKLVEDKMASSAVIMVHDYNNPALPGVKKAVDEWMSGKDLKMEVYQSIAIIKCAL